MRFRSLILIAVFAVCGGLMLPAGASAQNKTYIWVRVSEAGQYPGYKRVIGGRLDKGLDLPVCRAGVNGFLVPGKYFGTSCLVPWNGKELAQGQDIDLLLTNKSWSWRQVHDVSKTQIQQGAVYASDGQASSGNQYICRWRFANGVHNGKYAIGTGYCYVSFGGKEYVKSDGFEIMFP